MPISESTGKQNSSKKSRESNEKKSELIHRVKYNNTLPDIPFDPKFIAYPFDSNRFVQYHPTSLEHTYKYELLTEYDLGVKIDLINPNAYKIQPSVELHPDDAKLLEDDSKDITDIKRSRHHNKNVSWLRKTEYISTELNRFMQHSDKQESKIGYKKNLKDDELYRDRESQLAAIENTFKETEKEITKHYSKPGVVAVDVKPIFPDFEMWHNPFAQVIFDSDPSVMGPNIPPNTVDEMSQAMIRGMVDENGDQFVAYFLPTDETLEKRKNEVDEQREHEESNEEYDYRLAREYNWNVKNKASKGYEETYFFVIRDDGVYYNELETRVRLSKRRKVGVMNQKLPNSKLSVSHRELTEEEISIHDNRRQALETLMEEDDQLPSDTEGHVSAAESSSSSVASSEIRRRQRSRSSVSGASGSSSDGAGTSSSENEEEEKASRDAAAQIFGSSSEDSS